MVLIHLASFGFSFCDSASSTNGHVSKDKKLNPQKGEKKPEKKLLLTEKQQQGTTDVVYIQYNTALEEGNCTQLINQNY